MNIEHDILEFIGVYAKAQFCKRARMGFLENQPYCLIIDADYFTPEDFKEHFETMGRASGGAVIADITGVITDLEGRAFFLAQTQGQPTAVQAMFLGKNTEYAFTTDIRYVEAKIKESVRRVKRPTWIERAGDLFDFGFG